MSKFNKMVIFTLICCFFFVLKIDGAATTRAEGQIWHLDWQGYVQACGSALMDLVFEICKNKVHVREIYPTGSHNSFIKRRTRGIATECCFTICRVSNIKEYCADQSMDSDYTVIRMTRPFYYYTPTIFSSTADPTTTTNEDPITNEDPTTTTTAPTTNEKPKIFNNRNSTWFSPTQYWH